MVGYDPKLIELSKFQIGLASFTTGCVSRALIQPFDVVKIRFQIQHEPISKSSQNSKYKSLPNAIYTIYKEEGIKSFWKGHLTGQFLSTSFVVVQFTAVELLTKHAYKITPKSVENTKLHALRDFLCGGIAASFGILCVQPLDVVRTRFVAQGEPKLYENIPDALKKIFQREGIRGFYKGVVPSLIQMTPQSAVTFSIYGLLNTYWKNFSTFDDYKGLKSSINGFIAGIAAKSLIYPFDVVKKRLQIQGFEEARISFGKVVKYNGLFDCFHKTFTHEGVKGLYKGYLPAMLKGGTSTALIFFLYEQITFFMRIVKIKKIENS